MKIVTKPLVVNFFFLFSHLVLIGEKLLYSVGFCQQCESAVSVRISTPSELSASTLPQPTPLVVTDLGAAAPVLFSGFPLAVCFTHDDVYVSMLLSQFVPPSPSHAAATGLFSVSPSLPCR